MYKTVYGYNEAGVFTGECRAQLDKNDNLMMPPMTTTKPPNKPKHGFDVIYKDGKWGYISNKPSEEELKRIEDAEAAAKAEAEAMKPYMRLAELDGQLPRVVEDVAELTGRKLTSKEQAAKDEKAAIRLKLKESK